MRSEFKPAFRGTSFGVRRLDAALLSDSTIEAKAASSRRTPKEVPLNANLLLMRRKKSNVEFVSPLPYSFAQLRTIMTLGTEWLIDASGCDADALANLDRLRAVFDRIIRDLDLHVLGEIAWHQFDHPNGVSGLALLSESHLTCHTYPEFRSATFNLYCCRDSVAWPWEETLKEMLGATEVNVRVFERVIANAMAGAAK